MTDNYQIDKNSKLFQKFLNLKNNKGNDSAVEKSIQEPPKASKPNNRPAMQKHPQDSIMMPNSIQPSQTFGRNPTLHVTISDIEEAATLTLKPDNRKTQIPKKVEISNLQVEQLSKATTFQFDFASRNQSMRLTTQQDAIDEKAYDSYKPERARNGRNREFADRNRSRNENRGQRSFRMTESANNSKFLPLETQTNEQPKRQKENLMSLNEQEDLPVRQEHTFTLGSKQGELKKKYQKLNQKYEQLKQSIQKQRKQKQLQLNQKQSQMELIRQKVQSLLSQYFQVRSNEDTLTNELKRVKERLQNENIMRTKFEQQVKEYSFKIQELEDMLDGKDANLKKKTDEINHWKNQNQLLRGQLKNYNAEIDRLEQRCQFLQSESRMVKKDIQNKDSLIEQLRKNVATLIEENNIAKDEIYKLTIKSYYFQQNNQVLKADILRKQKDQPHHMSLIQQNFTRSIENLSPKRQRYERNDPVNERNQRPQRRERQNNGNNPRKRQFARQRAVTTKPVEREQRKNQVQQIDRRNQIPPQQHQQQKGSRESAARIVILQTELQKLRQMKVLNGKMRKQRIQMQRQLQQLLSK